MTTLLIGQQDGNGTQSSTETCRILRFRRPHHGRILHGKIGIYGCGSLQNLTKGSEWFFLPCSFGLLERSTDNSTGVHTEHTPVACITSTTVFSQARTCNACLRVKSWTAQDCSVMIVRMKIGQSSGQPWHLFAGLFHIFSLPVHHNTKHNLDSTTLSKTTLYIEHLFQNLHSRQAALTNRSRTSIARVAETRATPLPTCSNHDFLLPQLKNTWVWETSRKNGRMVLRHGRSCERVCGKILWTDHNFKEEELETVGELSNVCSQIVLKCLYLARIGGPDIWWSVNKLARSVTKWTRLCDRCSARLISYIRHTNDYRQCCHVGNTAQHCRLGLFQDSDFAGDLEDSKSTSGRIWCILGSRTFVPTSWMCKKQTSVSHSSTESDIISLDAASRMDGIPALDQWDVVIEVFHSSNCRISSSQGAAEHCLQNSNTKF